MYACTAARTGLAAIQRSRLFIRHGLRLFGSPRLMPMARHCFVSSLRGLGARDYRRHMLRMNGSHGRRRPVEHEGQGEQ